MVETSTWPKTNKKIPCFFQLASCSKHMIIVRRSMVSISGLRTLTGVIRRLGNIASKASWETPFGSRSSTKYPHRPWPPSPHHPTEIPFLFQCHDYAFRPVHQRPPLAFQFGSLTTKEGHRHQETAEATDKHARWDEQAHGPFPWGNWSRKNVVHQQKRHLDSKASCSESRFILIRVADLPLSECALYRQTEQERHFRWRGWMLRPRVIRSPINPKWERSRVRVLHASKLDYMYTYNAKPVYNRPAVFICAYVPRKSHFLIIFI